MKKLFLVILSITFVFGLSACGDTTEEEWDTSSSISVYTRDTTSGTRAGFMGGIGFDEAKEDDGVLVDGFVIKDNTGIFSTMQTDEFGIGYISMATLTDDVKGLAFNGVEPTIANTMANEYELKRPFNYVTRALDDYASDTEKNITLAFVAFMKTLDGSDIITNQGAIPLESTQTWDEIKADYPVCEQDNSGVTIKFGGSDSIEKIAKALTESFAPKCGNFVPEHDHTGSSDGFKRTQGEEKDGDNYKHIGFASRPFKDSEAGAEGTQGQLANDAIVAIVHKSNPLNGVTAEELVKIYSGEITTWDELLD
ncbi:MAG: substrate-binding domain-containing protein [Candidatus Izimaplasma sp.]|nr:substrate-binding domain-containing protein [Candidatus Izimaplasma bacterium]